MTSLDRLNPDFRDLLLEFHAHDVEFLIVGAYAVAFHGVPRATGDIDIFIRPSTANAERAWNALAAFGTPLGSANIEPRDLGTPGTVYQIGLPPRRIDILTTLSGISFDEAWASRQPAELDGHTVYFIGREALLRNKRASGRAKDLGDIQALERAEGGGALK